MKNKKMLKVLSTSFILGTILMTSPSFAEKVGGEVPLSENLTDNKESTNDVISESNKINVTYNESEITKEKEKLELKEAVKADENEEIEYKNYETEVKYDSNMAYGDFRVDQEGVLGQYKDGKELVKTVNKIITVGTNKDLVEKIKYNEKYSIEDPGTFNYTEHALRNIKATGKGLQRTIYYLAENNSANDGSESWAIQVNIEDGADITKDLENLYKLGKNKDNLVYIQKSDQYNHLRLNDFSKLNYGNGLTSNTNNYVNLWLLNKRGELGKRPNRPHVLEDTKKFINECNNSRELIFSVNDNYKIPFVERTYENSNDSSTVYLTRELFDKIYSEIIIKLRNVNVNKNLIKYDGIYANSIFVEDPASLQFDYDKNVNSNHHFAITTQDVTNINSDLYLEDSKLNEENSNALIANKLNPEKIYEIHLSADGYSIENQKNIDPLAKKYLADMFENYGGNRSNYFYYNVKNIPYYGDESLKFKEKKLMQGDDKKNLVLPYFGDKDGYIDFYKYYLAQLEIDNTMTSEDKKEAIKEITDAINKLEKAKDLVEFGEILGDTEQIIKPSLVNKQLLEFVGKEHWGNKISNYAIGNVDTKIEEQEFKVIKKDVPTMEKGKTKVVTKGVKGKKVTKTTYKVNRINGELTDPITNVVEDIKPID